MAKYNVELTYFKQFGKYYSEGKLKLPDHLQLYEIWDHVRARRAIGQLPGLREGYGSDFNILINVPGHPHEHPHLIMVEK